MNDLSMAALALAGAASLALVAGVALWWRPVRRAVVHLEDLQAQVRRLLEAQQAIDLQLEALAALIREENAHAAFSHPATGRSYELAAHLASSGAAPEQLIAQCGLTPAEAQLAIRIHGLGGRAGPGPGIRDARPKFSGPPDDNGTAPATDAKGDRRGQ